MSDVEIGGQVMTQAQFDAARYPLLVSITELEARIAAVKHEHRANEHFPYYCVTCRCPRPCSTMCAAVIG